MKAKSILVSSASEVESSLSLCIKEGFKPTLAIIFMSIKQDRARICSILTKEGIRIFGATSAGEFCDSNIGEGSIAILLLDIDHAYFNIILKEVPDNEAMVTAAEIGVSGKQFFSNPAFIVAFAGLSIDGTKIIKGIEDGAGSNASIFGGIAGDDHTGDGSFIFDNEQVFGNGLISLVVDQDKINITGFATSGWQPVGTNRLVTSSEGLVVHTIDHEPAMDLISKFMGLSFDNASSEGMIYISEIISPIQLMNEDGTSVMREIRGVNAKDRSVMFAGPVPQGSTFRFSLPPDWDIIDKIKLDCNDIQEKQQAKADALLVFSCASRLFSLGPMIKQEIEEISKIWDCPLAGFFCYGEIGKAPGGKTTLHNNTCSIVVLEEKS